MRAWIALVVVVGACGDGPAEKRDHASGPCEAGRIVADFGGRVGCWEDCYSRECSAGVCQATICADVPPEPVRCSTDDGCAFNVAQGTCSSAGVCEFS